MIAAIQPPAGYQAAGQVQWLQQLTPLAGALVLGLILGSWGHFLSMKRETRNRVKKAIDDFLAIVAQQRAKLNAMSRREDVFFVESIFPLSEAVFRLQHVLPGSRWTRLREILRDYEAHRREQFGGTREMLAVFLTSGQKPEDGLNALLDRFYSVLSKTRTNKGAEALKPTPGRPAV